MGHRLLIIGAGELGQQIFHYALIEGKYTPIGYVDDTIDAGTNINGLTVIGGIDDIPHIYNRDGFDAMIIGIGYKHLKIRDKLYKKFSSFIPFATIIASPTYIDESSKIGDGCILYPGCIIDKNVVINNNSILNLGCIVAHDSTIGRSSFCAPRVTIAGFSSVGNRCMIGAGSTIRDNVSVCDDTVVGMMSGVVKSINTSGVYYGIPARRNENINK